VRHYSLYPFLFGLLVTGCAGPYVVEEVNIQNGMVVGEETVAVNADGRVSGVDQEGYVPNNRYLDDSETDDVNLGPNAPGYIP
jgi:hypothetical protein